MTINLRRDRGPVHRHGFDEIDGVGRGKRLEAATLWTPTVKGTLTAENDVSAASITLSDGTAVILSNAGPGQYVRFDATAGPMGLMFTGDEAAGSGHEAKIVYRTSPNEIVFEAGDDNDVLVLQGFGATIGASPQVLVPDGSTAAPGLAVIGDEDTGLDLGVDFANIVTGGSIRIWAGSGGDAGVRDSSGNAVAYHDDSAATWRINKQSGASQTLLLLVEDNGTDRFRVDAASHTTTGDIIFLDTGASAVYRWDQSTESHVFYTDSGSTRVTIDAGGIISHTFGTAAAPSVEIDGRGGMYSPGTGAIALGANIKQIQMNGTGATPSGDIIMFDAAGGEIYRWDDSEQDHEWRDSADNLMRLQSTRLDLDWGSTLAVLRLPVRTSTGHPPAITAGNGDMYVNTADDAVYCYADGAWRTLVSWAP